MPVFSRKYDTQPQSVSASPRGPKISDMRTALNTYNATSYSTARLDQLSENDLIYACRLHNLTVGGL